MADQIAELFEQLSYWGIALAMLLENVFPPLPSEAVLPAAGLAARRGELTLAGVIAAASFGSLLGAVFWYYVGLWIGSDRLREWTRHSGRYFGFRPNDVDRANAWFARWGTAVVFFGRMIPGVRTLVSVPAGVAHMPLTRFIACSAAGITLWSALLATLGWWAGRSAKTFEEAIAWTSAAVVGAILLWLLIRVARSWRSARNETSTEESRPLSSFSSRTKDRGNANPGSQKRDHTKVLPNLR